MRKAGPGVPAILPAGEWSADGQVSAESASTARHPYCYRTVLLALDYGEQPCYCRSADQVRGSARTYVARTCLRLAAGETCRGIGDRRGHDARTGPCERQRELAPIPCRSRRDRCDFGQASACRYGSKLALHLGISRFAAQSEEE